MDLQSRKGSGEKIDSKNIRKHKNDIYRLGQLLGAERKTLSDEIKEDMTVFLDKFEKEHVDLKAIDVRGITKEQIIQRMRHCYGIGDI